MRFRRVGNSGLKVSEISFGTWFPQNRQDDLQVELCIKEALKKGINHFDTADVYLEGRAEKILGTILNDETYQRKDLVNTFQVICVNRKNT